MLYLGIWDTGNEYANCSSHKILSRIIINNYIIHICKYTAKFQKFNESSFELKLFEQKVWSSIYLNTNTIIPETLRKRTLITET